MRLALDKKTVINIKLLNGMIINIHHSQLDKAKEPISNGNKLKLKLYPVLSDQIIFA